MTKPSTIKPNRIKAKYDTFTNTTKALLKFILGFLVLIVIGLIYHFNTDQSMASTQKFFEQRKDVQEYHTYTNEEESAKKRAEKNIFLQN